MAYEYQHLGSYVAYLEKRKREFSYQERHPEIKAIADAFRKKRGRKGLKQLSAELGCVRPFEVDRFFKGAKLAEHQIEAIKKWLIKDESEATCPHCGATIVTLMTTCINPYCQKEI